MLTGLTIQQYKDIVEFVNRYHKFGVYTSREQHEEDKKTYPNMCRPRYGIKYIDNCYDTRDGYIFSVSFRIGNCEFNFRTNYFIENTKPDWFKYSNLYEWIMDWLKGNIKHDMTACQ